MRRFLAMLCAAALAGCGGSGGGVGAVPAPGGGGAAQSGSVAQERLVVQMDVNGDDALDYLTLDTSQAPFRIVEALEGTHDGTMVDVTSVMAGVELDAEISRALAEHMASSFSAASRAEIDVRNAAGDLTTVVVFE